MSRPFAHPPRSCGCDRSVNRIEYCGESLKAKLEALPEATREELLALSGSATSLSEDAKKALEGLLPAEHEEFLTRTLAATAAKALLAKTAAAESSGLAVETRVKAKYLASGANGDGTGDKDGGDCAWYTGKITAIEGETYSIQYDDGDTESGVRKEYIELMAESSGLAVETRVKAKYLASGANGDGTGDKDGGDCAWYTGKITAIEGETYSIQYDDGDTESGVRKEYIELMAVSYAVAETWDLGSSWHLRGDVTKLVSDARLPLENGCLELVKQIDALAMPNAEQKATMMVSRGVQVQWLIDFFKLNVPKDEYLTMTTKQVVDRCIIPATEATRCRYADVPGVERGVATTFVSHTWGGVFGDLVAGIAYVMELTDYVWLECV